MADLQIFRNESFGEIRTLNIDGEPWFVGKDVAEILGYTNPQKAIRDHIDEEDKTLNESFTVNGTKGILINESGLYSLILSSKLPSAKQFKRWVTNEVLPSIRKHGVYATAETAERLLNDPDFMIRTFTALKEEREKNAALQSKIEQDKPKVLFADAVSTAKTSILVGELAKLLKQNGIEIGGTRLFAWLRENGYLIKRNGTDYNMPTQYSMELGLFEIKETSITHSDGHVTVQKTPKVTGKGQAYFVNKFLGERKEEIR
ncbi:phage antirepressor KilAC domain-containing protein [Gudongella oleilytica]|uniref:phage antirepressor n=1 Tax=Gudongella oleilytica TaxID=1582259 RepID=UPI002A36656E|nr:phage antirepressor KilAC domain-containing protein [Gudongella oleilytica]MDY0256225.1 phage antirepressor KilAC domain-containing protein [Gudongella oleilytica]